MNRGVALKILGVVASVLAVGMAVLLMIAFAYALRSCKPYDPEAEAERALGSGAVCADESDRVTPCVYQGERYQCVRSRVDGRRIACAKVTAP